MSTKLITLILAAAAACSSNNGKAADAPNKTFMDAPNKVFMDAPNKVFMDAAKVFMDAPAQSTVNVVANCTNVSAADIGATITTAANADAFSPTTATITHGQYVKFTTTGFHNFENQVGAPATATFVSGSPGSQTACLQFTVAGSYPFQCEIHGSMGMVGTLTVN
jgi:plastocyanin